MLDIPLSTQNTLLKYIGGLHNYLKHTLLVFNPTKLDNFYVQDTYLEERGEFVRDGNKKNASNNNSKKNKGKEKEKEKTTSTIQNEKPKEQCIYCEGHLEAKCWKLHPNQCPNSKWKEKKKQVSTLKIEV